MLCKQDNEILHSVFGFEPKKKLSSGSEKRISGVEKVVPVLSCL